MKIGGIIFHGSARFMIDFLININTTSDIEHLPFDVPCYENITFPADRLNLHVKPIFAPQFLPVPRCPPALNLNFFDFDVCDTPRWAVGPPDPWDSFPSRDH